MQRPLYDNAFQMAYVTRDLDGAIARYKALTGVGDFLCFDTQNGVWQLRVALAWAGDRMVEFLAPVGEVAPLYAHALPEAPDGLVFHHVGHLLTTEEDWNTVAAAVAASGRPIGTRISVPDQVEIIYLDTRAVDGIFHEYVYAKPAGLDFFNQVPRN